MINVIINVTHIEIKRIDNYNYEYKYVYINPYNKREKIFYKVIARNSYIGDTQLFKHLTDVYTEKQVILRFN